jgi:hypothetical protein
MVTKEFPVADEFLAETRTVGVPSMMMSKLRLFDPDEVEPQIGLGGHGAEPAGHVVYPLRDEVLLFHYKDMGLEYRDKRNRLLKTGLRDGDRANNWGFHYDMDSVRLQEHFDQLWASAVDVRAPAYVPWRDHQEPRFWRAQDKRQRRHPRLHRLWKGVKRFLR